MIINYDGKTRIATIEMSDLDVAIYEDAFVGGPQEALESLLVQNRRQRRDQLVDAALREVGDGPVSFTDKDDLAAQHISRPGYDNAKRRDIKRQLAELDGRIEGLKADPKSPELAAAKARHAELTAELKRG